MNMSFKNITLLLVLILILFSSINFISAVDLNNSSISEFTDDNPLNDFNDVIAINKCDELDKEILGDDGTDESALDNGYVIYVGNHNKTETGNGSEDNPFSTLKLACDNVSGQDKVTVKVFNGTYYMGSYLQFNTNNLNIEGINGKVIVTYLYDTEEDGDYGEAFGLTSTSANFTISNIIFDGRNRNSYDGFFDAEDGYPDDPDAMGPYKSFFLPFYGYANIGTFNNCSFLFGDINTRLTGASEYKSKFINCYFDVTNNWNLLFYGGQFRDDNAMVAGFDDVTGVGPQFEYCSFNLPNIYKLVASIHLPYTISITNAWFGQNELPAYVGPFSGDAIVKPGGSYDWDWTVPVNRYAIFSVSENYLGNNQFEIVGKLTWNGTNSQEGMENFQPMTVTLSSDTGDIVTKAILVNGTFKANYTSQAPINKITATLDSQPLELEFYSVNISADTPSIYYGQDQNLTLNFTQPIDATILITISNENYNESYEIYVNNKDSIVYTIYDTLKEGIYTVDINLNDNKYFGENSTTLTISKISDYLFDVIIPSEAKVGENATITLTLPEDVDGNVTIKFGSNIKVLDANQTMTIDFNNLNATTYDINVTYSGSDKYASKEKIDSITIDKADSNVNVEDIAFTYGDVITIPFTVTNATGVNVRVLNKEGDEVTITNSTSVDFTLETLPAGEYTLEVTTIVDEKNYYDFTVDDIVLTINKAESSLTLNNSYEFIYGQDAVINVVTENSTGDVIVSLVGEDDFTASVSGNEINLPVLNAGKYRLTVTTNVDDNHNNITKSTTITIAKTNPSMNVFVKLSDNVTVKDNITLIINLPSDATGEVVVKINGKKTDTIHSNETITINLNNQLVGECIVDIIYSGDKNYESDSATQEFTISKAETSISAEQIASEEGTATIEVTISDVNSGIILVDVDGKKFYGDINKGKSTINIEGVSEGNYTANIKFFGDDKYNQATTTADVKVSEDKIITELKEQLEEANAKVDNLTGELANATDRIADLTAELNETQANATKLSEDLADAQANVTKLSDDLADAHAKVDNLTGELANATAKVDNLTGELANAVANVTKLADDLADANAAIDELTRQLEEALANKTKTVVVDGVEYPIEYVNGTAVVNINKTEMLSAEFDKITVSGSNIDAVLVDSEGKPVAGATIAYKVNGVESNITTDDDGRFMLKIAPNSIVEISYAGSETVAPVNVSINLQGLAPVRQATLFNSNDFSQYACDFYEGERGGNFTFQLVDEMGNPIANKTIYIGYNGVTLNRTTDENGFANVQINLKNAGLYTFVIVFLGDEDYNATMAVHKVNIEKKTTSISASAKTYKATAKTKKYTVTLKTIKGSSIDGKTYLAKGKKVTLTINGKTYTAKTNAKGQATFSLKITKKGKFAAKVSFAGDNTYKEANKSVKLTIK